VLFPRHAIFNRKGSRIDVIQAASSPPKLVQCACSKLTGPRCLDVHLTGKSRGGWDHKLW
jgi:hypothetical protein